MKNKKLFKKILSIILAVIILAGIIAGGIYYKSLSTKKQIKSMKTQEQEEQGQEQTTKDKANSTRVSIDDNWDLYTNYKLGFSMEVPKNVAGMLNNEIVPFEISENDDGTVGMGMAWRITIKDGIKNDDDLLNFIQSRYMKECLLGDKKESNQKGTYNVSIDENGASGGEGCFLNFGIVLKYNPSLQKVANWNTGQTAFFWLPGTNSFQDNIDYDIVNSFKFIGEAEEENDLTGWNISIKNGDIVHSGTMQRTKIYILAKDKDNNQKTIYTFNDKATEKQEMEEVRFLNFDKEGKKILIHYKKWHDICKTGTPENCQLWDYFQLLENGIFNVNLVTGTLEKVFDFKDSEYTPQSVVYSTDYKTIDFIDLSESKNAMNVYAIWQDGKITKIIPSIEKGTKDWDSIHLPSFASVSIVTAPGNLCFRSNGTEGSKEWTYDFEGVDGHHINSVIQCSKTSDQDNINFNGSAIIGTEIQEIELGAL